MGRGNEHRSSQRQSGVQPADPWGDYARQPFYDRATSPPTPRQPAGREAEARVKWFNPEKEFSFVELTDGSGEAFLHIRQVEATGCSNLPAGTTLLIQVGPSQKGPQVKGIVRVDISTAAPEPTRRRPYATEAASSRFRQGSSPVTTPDTMGTVKWYDEVKGFGFIAVAGESKDLFVHASALERAGLSQLEQRQAVRVAIVDGRKGREVEAIKLA